MRIRDDDCDVELLEESDIYETEPTDPLLFGEQTKTHVVYAVHQAKLSILCKSNFLISIYRLALSVHECSVVMIKMLIGISGRDSPDEVRHRQVQ